MLNQSEAGFTGNHLIASSKVGKWHSGIVICVLCAY